ncbi:cell division FtsA domain-containing protein [Metabacillus sp. HB246100]
MNNTDLTFALDIGTRSVVGLMLKEEDGYYYIIDTVIKEHDKRAMLDGQIHDVLAVANVITDIKHELEATHGPLKKVCVAAAGRALKTERAVASFEIQGKPMIQKEDILHLELMGVQIAQQQLAQHDEQDRAHHYDCVGYSVLHYLLDGEEIGSLIDQQGDEASVEIIATFLPKIVVESLLAALNRADLEMEALTLEPIAAINVLIPESMRRLNVVLVDIGAGTSDIAITDLGTIISYGMVPIAGDEITEAMSDEFLLDFPKAEEAKRQLSTQESITVTDILGFETEIPKEEAISKISHAIDKLALAIKEEIYLLNNGIPPKAVMLVGGGSLTPSLPSRLSQLLGLPENRVAIRGIDAIQQLKLADHVQKGPELVTPIGIAVSSKQNPIQYISVKVNDRAVRLFHMKTLTVADSLLASGIQVNRLYGKPGMALIVNLNGQTITIPGEYGTPPIMKKNGILCSLEDGIKHGDHIIIEKGCDGNTPKIPISQLLDEVPSKAISLNGEIYTVHASIRVNQKTASLDTILTDRDQVICTIPSSISDALKSIGFYDDLLNVKPFSIELDDNVVQLEAFSGKLYKNGLLSSKEAKVEHGDVLVVKPIKTPTLQEFILESDLVSKQTLPIFFNEQELVLEKELTEFYRKETKLSYDDLIYNGDQVKTKRKPVTSFIFQDLFTIIDIDIPSTGNTQFQLLKNKQEVSFQEPLSPGDHLTIKWL